MRRTLPILATAVACFVAAGSACAQETHTLAPVPGSRIEVDGTSNRSDWTVEAREVGGWFTVSSDEAGPVVSAGEVHVPASSMKSAQGVIMDRLMKSALKASEFGDIAFVMSGEATVAPVDTGYTVRVPGTLTIAGQSNDVVLEVVAVPDGEDGWRFRGNHAVTMTEYGMRPPTALFGALVTGDDVVVRFDVVARPAAE